MISISLKDLIEYMFLWTIWLCLYFCKRSDHMICISVNSLSPYYCIQEICVERSVFFVKDLITGSLFLSTIRISPHFCQRFYHMYSRLNDLITTIFCERFNHLSILWPMSLHHHFAKHVWLQVYFRDRFDYIFYFVDCLIESIFPWTIWLSQYFCGSFHYICSFVHIYVNDFILL